MAYIVMPMDLCNERKCGNPHHKFDSCRDEIVYGMSLEWPDDQTGESDSYHGHFAIMSFDVDYVGIIDMGPNKDDHAAMVPAGTYIVQTVSSGAVHVTHYPPSERGRAEDVFATEARLYAEWEDGESEDSEA